MMFYYWLFNTEFDFTIIFNLRGLTHKAFWMTCESLSWLWRPMNAGLKLWRRSCRSMRVKRRPWMLNVHRRHHHCFQSPWQMVLSAFFFLPSSSFCCWHFISCCGFMFLVECVVLCFKFFVDISNLHSLSIQAMQDATLFSPCTK